MALNDAPRDGYFLIRVEGEDNHPGLQDVSSFLYDFNLVYEISRLATDPKYEDYRFTRFIWNRRRRRPFLERDRLHVDTLQLGSPFLLATVVEVGAGAVAAVYGIIQIAEKIADWRPNRAIRRLEQEELAKKLREKELPPPPSAHSFAEALQERGALSYYERSIKRLAENEVQITELNVSIVPQLPPKRDEP